jgi:CHASE2 domain-containing sensor protein/signal transduction histidine kinase
MPAQALRRRSRWTRQWLGLLLAMSVVLVLACTYRWFWRLDFAVYDASLPSRPASPDVVIVAIDDASIESIGRWPWRRAVHATLLERLRALGARIVALDILMTEADQDDALLASAMRQGLPTVLPLMVRFPRKTGYIREEFPVPPLAKSAAAIGHVNVDVDPDGMVRSLFLEEGLGSPEHPYLATALLEYLSGGTTRQRCGANHPDLQHAPLDVWVRDCQILIPYSGPPGHFAQVSYVDVLSGRVSDSAIRGKIVLVGATAQGVGDAWSTPVSGGALAMPGVEVMANVLQAQRDRTLVRKVRVRTTILLTLLPVYLLGLALLVLTPRWSLMSGIAIWLGTLGGSVIALQVFHWWWPPSAALLAILALYPLWSWRRLVAAQLFMDEEFARLAGVERLLPPQPAPNAENLRRRSVNRDGGIAQPASQSPGPADRGVDRPQPPSADSGAGLARTTSRSSDPVERRIDLLRSATQSLRDARQHLADTINGLPNATLVADTNERIALANPAAAVLFGASDSTAMTGKPVDDYLYAVAGDPAVKFAALRERGPGTIEISLPEPMRCYLVRTAPFIDSDQQDVGMILTLTDITELRKAQRERDDVIRFLSHDMKSPASSLMGLAQLQRDPQRALSPLELSNRLDVLAQRTLTLVDGFVALARAESSDPSKFDEFDVRDAIQDAYDEVWAAARAREITITLNAPTAWVLVDGDRQLLARAIVNLLSNAIKFSPDRSAILLECRQQDATVVICVTDEGPGIEPSQQALVFQRFTRGVHRGANDPGGAGLGLAFVRVVAEKHGGRVWIQDAASLPGVDSTNDGDSARTSNERDGEGAANVGLAIIDRGNDGSASGEPNRRAASQRSGAVFCFSIPAKT